MCEENPGQSVGCSFLEGEKLGPELGEEGGALRGVAGGGGLRVGQCRFALPGARCLLLLPLGAGR